ncbi:MAG: MICOS complex subunit MIC60 [Candidatus Gastranaerophilales bacterium]|nr:MICOS complex subunit MIC60 [Candidatus Gastranaerophilales bacterium]
MGKNLVILFLIGILTAVTVLVGIMHPSLHKQAMFTDEYHRFVEEDIPISSIGFSNVSSLPAKVESPPTVSSPQRVYSEPQKRVNSVLQPKSAPQTAKAPQKQPVNNKPSVAPQKTQKQDAPPPQEIKKTADSTPKKELTEQEEIIAWNIWRSNLQNQVMKDSQIRAPLGTSFRFTFTVDKYGNMSNIKVWSTNPSYTDLAVRAIKPVLLSYQHKPILNFPAGTKRVITNVTGGFYIWTTSQYSSPSDYSDYERVKTHK